MKVRLFSHTQIIYFQALAAIISFFRGIPPLYIKSNLQIINRCAIILQKKYA